MPKRNSELARPTVLTDDAKALILALVAEGNYLKVACEAARFCYPTLSYWRRQCEAGDPNASAHTDFFAALKSATAAGEVNSLKAVRSGVPGWQGSAWFLERRFPSRWARKDRPPDPPKGEDESGAKPNPEAIKAARQAATTATNEPEPGSDDADEDS